MPKPVCAFEACERESKTVNLCHAHYEQKRRGKPLTQLTLQALTFEQRFWSKVDKSSDCWEWTAYVSKAGYGAVQYDGRVRPAHRVSYEIEHGRVSSDLEIDHKCHNRSCVNPAHLQAVPKNLNQENRSGLTSRNTSGFRGVKWNKDRRKWEASVKKDGRSYYCGLFTSAEEAGQAALAKRLELQTNNLLDRKAS